MLDGHASLVEMRSERKQGAPGHFERGFGLLPMFCVTGTRVLGLPLVPESRAERGLGCSTEAITAGPCDDRPRHYMGFTLSVKGRSS